MKNAKDDDLVFLGVDLMHDDVGEAGNCPLECPRRRPDMAYLGKFAETVAVCKNAVDDMRGCVGVLCLNVKVDRGDVIKRFKRAASYPRLLPRALYLRFGRKAGGAVFESALNSLNIGNLVR
jgi:hypothetical protein